MSERSEYFKKEFEYFEKEFEYFEKELEYFEKEFEYFNTGCVFEYVFDSYITSHILMTE